MELSYTLKKIEPLGSVKLCQALRGKRESILPGIGPNKYMYSKREATAMTIFEFVENSSINDYASSFTYFHFSQHSAKNYTKSFSYPRGSQV